MNIRIIGLATLAASLAACSSMPEPNMALDQARVSYQTAQRDPQVTTLASEELRKAGDALQLAERAAAESSPKGTVDHLAYMTSQRVVIAQETAASLASQAVTAGAANDRNQTRLDMRTSEADAAKQQLAVAEQSNAQKTMALDRADARAVRREARLEQSDAKVADLEQQLLGMGARKTAQGMVVTLGGVLFYSGKSGLLPAAQHDLLALADFFKRNPMRQATIEGYTDNVGTAEANQALSSERAQSVVSALVGMGVMPAQLSMKAHGEEGPVASNDTPAGRQMNRRVEVVFAPATQAISTK